MTLQNSVNNRLSPSGTAVGIPSVYSYDQSSVPSSPTNGQTWRELDGSTGLPVEVWVYDGTNTRWVSERVYNGTVAGLALAATTTLKVPFGFHSNYTGVVLTRCEIIIGMVTGQTNHSASFYYTLAFLTYGQNTTTAISGVANQNTQTLSTIATYGQDTNIYYAIGASGITSWAMTLTKVSTPANINYTITFSSRKVR